MHPYKKCRNKSSLAAPRFLKFFFYKTHINSFFKNEGKKKFAEINSFLSIQKQVNRLFGTSSLQRSLGARPTLNQKHPSICYEKPP